MQTNKNLVDNVEMIKKNKQNKNVVRKQLSYLKTKKKQDYEKISLSKKPPQDNLIVLIKRRKRRNGFTFFFNKNIIK